MDFSWWNLGRRKAQLLVTPTDKDPESSDPLDEANVWVPNSSEVKVGSDAEKEPVERSPSPPDSRTKLAIDSTEVESKDLQNPQHPPTDTATPEFNISRATTLSDPVMSDAEIIVPKPPPRYVQPDQAGSCNSTPHQVPLPSSQGGSQSEDVTPSRPKVGILEEIGDLSKLRMGAVRTRHKTQEARTGLRQEREALDALDAHFIQEVRVIYASNPSAELARLLDLFEAMQSLRDRFYPLEDDYNRLEDSLEVEEFELEEAEASLYERWKSPRPTLPVFDDQVSLLLDEALQPSINGVHPDSQEPMYTNYLSRVGDANMVKERLQELRRERVHLIEEQRVRASVGRQLDEEALQFLETFDVEHEELRHQYAAIHEDLARMREEWPLSIPVPFATTQFADDSYLLGTGIIQQLTRASPLISASDLSDSAASSTPQSPRDAIAAAQLPKADPLLLPLDDASPTFTFSEPSESEPVPTVSYVNEWLLNRLRRSSMEVWRFKSAEEVQALNLEDTEVRDLVIQWWSKDATAEEFPSQERGGAISLSLTSNPGVKHGSIRRPWSDGVPYDFNRLAGRCQRADATGRGGVVCINFHEQPTRPLQNAQLSPSSA